MTGAQLHGPARLAAESHADPTGGNAEHLMRAAVIVVMRVDAVLPCAGPASALEQGHSSPAVSSPLFRARRDRRLTAAGVVRRNPSGPPSPLPWSPTTGPSRGREDLFGRVFSQPNPLARSMLWRARKTVRSPASTSADIVHNRKATLTGSRRRVDQKVSSPTRCCFA